MAASDDAGLEHLARSVATHLCETGRTFVAAESCTGGWIAKACTDLPGSSRWFLGGVVTYSNATKSRLLAVEPRLIELHGAVSEPVVAAMACGALERLGGDIAVAVSGIAGPDGGTPEKPVGTVWFAWAARAAPGSPAVSTAHEVFAGDRESIRRAAVHHALAGVLRR